MMTPNIEASPWHGQHLTSPPSPSKFWPQHTVQSSREQLRLMAPGHHHPGIVAGQRVRFEAWKVRDVAAIASTESRVSDGRRLRSSEGVRGVNQPCEANFWIVDWEGPPLIQLLPAAGHCEFTLSQEAEDPAGRERSRAGPCPCTSQVGRH